MAKEMKVAATAVGRQAARGLKSVTADWSEPLQFRPRVEIDAEARELRLYVSLFGASHEQKKKWELVNYGRPRGAVIVSQGTVPSATGGTRRKRLKFQPGYVPKSPGFGFGQTVPKGMSLGDRFGDYIYRWYVTQGAVKGQNYVALMERSYTAAFANAMRNAYRRAFGAKVRADIARQAKLKAQLDKEGVPYKIFEPGTGLGG